MKTSFALIRRSVCIRARKVIISPSISAARLVRNPTGWENKRPTLEIYILEQQSIFMSPSFALVHAVRTIQFREHWGAFLQKSLVCDPGHCLPLLRFGLRPLPIRTSSRPLGRNNLPTLAFVLAIGKGGRGAIGLPIGRRIGARLTYSFMLTRDGIN
jgi:hypothetical protein